MSQSVFRPEEMALMLTGVYMQGPGHGPHRFHWAPQKQIGPGHPYVTFLFSQVTESAGKPEGFQGFPRFFSPESYPSKNLIGRSVSRLQPDRAPHQTLGQGQPVLSQV